MPMEKVAACARFGDLAWRDVAPGAREKVARKGQRRLRLLELTEEFEEADWCRNPHWGIVLEGEMDLEFPAERARLGPGDGLALPPEDTHRHKAHVEPGGTVLLFLVEPLD